MPTHPSGYIPTPSSGNRSFIYPFPPTVYDPHPFYPTSAGSWTPPQIESVRRPSWSTTSFVPEYPRIPHGYPGGTSGKQLRIGGTEMVDASGMPDWARAEMSRRHHMPPPSPSTERPFMRPFSIHHPGPSHVLVPIEHFDGALLDDENEDYYRRQDRQRMPPSPRPAGTVVAAGQTTKQLENRSDKIGSRCWHIASQYINQGLCHCGKQLSHLSETSALVTMGDPSHMSAFYSYVTSPPLALPALSPE